MSFQEKDNNFVNLDPQKERWDRNNELVTRLNFATGENESGDFIDVSKIPDTISLAIACVDENHLLTYTNNAFCEIVNQSSGSSDVPEDESQEPQSDWSLQKKQLLHKDFYKMLRQPDIIGPDYSPFHTVRLTGKQTETTISVGQKTYEMTVIPCYRHDKEFIYYYIELADAKKLVDIEKRLKRLQEIERSLMDLSEQEIETLNMGDRRNLLISRIETYIQELFGYQIYEFRLLDRITGKLEPFLSKGFSEEAANRILYANPSDYGITGYVAYFGKPYLCEDPFGDPLYLRASDISRRSYTLPLLYQNELVGTCNVESEHLDAFTARELYLLQFFVTGVANALHTQELLKHENQKGSIESVLKIQLKLSDIIDIIRENTCSLIDVLLLFTQMLKEQQSILELELSGEQDAYMEPTIVRQVLMDNIRTFVTKIGNMGVPLNAILEASDQMQKAIHKERLSLEQTLSKADSEKEILARFLGRRVLVVDNDEEYRQSAHRFFEQYGCIVDTARDALAAICMIKKVKYDLILSQLYPDGGMNGEQFFMRLCELYGGRKVPMLLTADLLIHDSGHMVKNSMLKGMIGSICRQQYYPKRDIPLFLRVFKLCDVPGSHEPVPMVLNHEEKETPVLFGSVGKDDHTTHLCGFHLHEKAKRFNEWVMQFSENSTPDSNLGSGTSLDAT